MFGSIVLTTVLALAVPFVSAVRPINILIGNDDGFAAANVREAYRLLKAAGHNVVLVASADNQSGQGGRSVFTNLPTLPNGSEYGLIPAGAPSFGRDPTDANVWYYNGTPAACAIIGLDYIIPNYYNNRSIDLVVAGPNFGTNFGEFLYTLSGTMGYTYTSVEKGYPAIAFSGGNGAQRSYTSVVNKTAAGLPDPATIQGQLVVTLVNKLVDATPKGKPLMPVGFGLSVNTPTISSATDSSCINPPFIQTRLTGGAYTDTVVRNPTTGLFTYANSYPYAINKAITGNKALPGETAINAGGCYSTVSVFSTDYDAPSGAAQGGLRHALEPLVEYSNPVADSVGPSKRSPQELKGRNPWTNPWRHE